MNKTLKSIIRIVSFILVLALVLTGVYKILSWKDTTGGYLSSAKQLYSTEDGLIDAAFVGTSHVYCGIYPSVIWEQYGYAVFDMSISGQDKDSAVHSIEEMCKTQSPKIVFVDMYALLFDGYLIKGNLYRNALAFRTSLNSIALDKDIVDEDELTDFIARWPIVHTRYAELDKYDFVQYQPSIYGRGEFYSDKTSGSVTFYPENINSTDVTPLSEVNRAWLDELVDLSEKYDFQLVFISIPFTAVGDEQNVINGAWQYAEDNGIIYLDMNLYIDELGLDTGSDFIDSYHLNYKGAQKLSSYLGGWLSNYADLSDRRGDSAYSLWEQDHLWYEHSVNSYSLNEATDLSSKVSMILDGQDLTTIISIEGDDLSGCPERYLSSLSAFGITASDLETGGKWEYKDGVLTKLMDNDPDSEPVLIKLSDTDTLKICFVRQLAKENIMLNLETKNQPYTYLTLIVYDEFLEEMILDYGE